MLSWNEPCLTGRHFIGWCLNGRVTSFQDRAPFYFGLLGPNAFRYIYISCIFKISDSYQAFSSDYNLGCLDVSSPSVLMKFRCAAAAVIPCRLRLRVCPIYLTIWNWGYPTPHSQNPFWHMVGVVRTPDRPDSSPPPISGSFPPVFVRLSPSSRMPRRLIFIAHPHLSSFLLFISFAPFSFPLFFTSTGSIFFFFTSSSVQPPAGLMPYFSTRSWLAP